MIQAIPEVHKTYYLLTSKAMVESNLAFGDNLDKEV